MKKKDLSSQPRRNSGGHRRLSAEKNPALFTQKLEKGKENENNFTINNKIDHGIQKPAPPPSEKDKDIVKPVQQQRRNSGHRRNSAERNNFLNLHIEKKLEKLQSKDQEDPKINSGLPKSNPGSRRNSGERNFLTLRNRSNSERVLNEKKIERTNSDKKLGGRVEVKEDVSVGKKFSIPRQFIQYLSQNGTYETDIFRTCFELEEIKNLTKIMNTSKASTIIDFSKFSISTVAFCLKKWLRESNRPLFPYKYFPEIIKIQEAYEGPAKMLKLTEILMKCKVKNRLMLVLLFDLLSDISDHRNNTLMDADKLAYTFGPDILRPEKLPNDISIALDQAKKVNSLIKDLIENSQEIFQNMELN